MSSYMLFIDQTGETLVLMEFRSHEDADERKYENRRGWISEQAECCDSTRDEWGSMQRKKPQSSRAVLLTLPSWLPAEPASAATSQGPFC